MSLRLGTVHPNKRESLLLSQNRQNAVSPGQIPGLSWPHKLAIQFRALCTRQLKMKVQYDWLTPNGTKARGAIEP